MYRAVPYPVAFATMNVLAVNCGSSTLKFALFELQHALGERRIAASLRSTRTPERLFGRCV